MYSLQFWIFFKLLMFFFVIFFYFRSTTFTEVIFTQSNFLSEEWQNCIHSAWHIWKISFKTVAKGEYPKRSPYIVGVHWLSVATIKKNIFVSSSSKPNYNLHNFSENSQILKTNAWNILSWIIKMTRNNFTKEIFYRDHTFI